MKRFAIGMLIGVLAGMMAISIVQYSAKKEYDRKEREHYTIVEDDETEYLSIFENNGNRVYKRIDRETGAEFIVYCNR